MLKNNRIKRFTAALLVGVFGWLGICPAAYARDTDFFADINDVAGDYYMDDFAYIQPDSSQFDTYRRQVLLMNDIKNRDELLKALLRFNDEYQRLHAAESLAMYQYYCQPVAYADTYRGWQTMLAQVDRDYRATWQELIASDNREMVEELVSPKVLAQFDGSAEVSDELLAYNQQIQAMAADYWQAADAEYKVKYNGKSYTFDDLAAIDDDETYMAVYKLLAKERNARVGGLLADIIPVANKYARGLGYSDYAAYAYAAVYGRDYTPEQAAKLHALVKQYVVPFYTELLTAEANPRFDWATLAADGDMSGEQLLAIMQKYLPQISDEYAAVFDYMQNHRLADVERDEQKLAASFTSYIPYFRIALLFIGSQSGTAHDISTLVHEFGHFAFYMYEQRDAGYDVGEFHSQALEMLFLHFADDIFGESGAAYCLNELMLQLKAVIDGCLYDEFQQAAYGLAAPTVADLNRLFHQLAQQYGYEYIHGDDEAYNWVTTAHTFIQPFYYMSYAVSGLSALELLGRADGDFAAACDSYLTMVALRETDYRAFVKKSGLSDVFTADGMSKIVDSLRTYFYEDICGLSGLGELQNHWAANYLLAAARTGLLTGDDSGSLAPDRQITRAEAVTLLWRLSGEPAADITQNFADVPQGAWYAKAAAWAKAQGISNGIGNGFAAEAKLTRDELVTMLWRLNGSPVDGADSTVLAGFTDSSKVAAWAQAAFVWAVADGKVQGAGDGKLHPATKATRAEVVAMLQK